MERDIIRAYAKINLGLDVIGKLPNGYHEVKMVMQTVGIYDELILEKAEGGVSLTTDCGELPTDGSNLICKAAELMRSRYGVTEGVRIRLHKKIPIAAGMAGGSTDAAATMKAMNRLFGLGVSREELMQAAVSIGADVPYCILGGTALAEGIGERLTVLRKAPPMPLLVAKPDINVSTKFVYEHLDAAKQPEHPDIDGMVEAIGQGSVPGIVERLGNVLETVTVPAYPVISVIKKRMCELGALGSLMSGSGPTVFGVFADKDSAGSACERLRQEGLAGQLFVTEPVE